MTYEELYDKANRMLDNSEITIGEYEDMIEPLKAEIKTRLIPVSERLPEKSGEYLVWVHPKGEKPFFIIEEIDCDGIIKTRDWNRPDEIKAWCELPEPYETHENARKRTETHECDCVSRQAVLDLLQMRYFGKAIYELPPVCPARPEPCDGAPDKDVGSITLENAIDYLHKIGWMQEHDRILTEHKEPCEYVISRQDAIDTINSLVSTMSVCMSKDELQGMISMKERAVDAVKMIQPVSPARAKGKCSACGSDTLWLYCPNCGAMERRMRGDNND